MSSFKGLYVLLYDTDYHDNILTVEGRKYKLPPGGIGSKCHNLKGWMDCLAYFKLIQPVSKFWLVYSLSEILIVLYL